MRTALYVLLGFVIGALIGATPFYLQLDGIRDEAVATEERLSGELDALRKQLAVSDIHSGLGRLRVLLEQEKFESASTLSTRIFDDIDRTLEIVEDPTLKRRLLSVQAQRDAMTSAIATENPDGPSLAARLFRALEDSAGPE